jgi:hypothetical protein
MDIVERLRSPEVLITTSSMISPVAFEAAGVIERLRDESNLHWNRYWDFARSYDRLKVAVHMISCIEIDNPDYDLDPRDMVRRIQEIARGALKEKE